LPRLVLPFVVLCQACLSFDVVVPPGYPPIPTGASSVRISDATFDQVRDALIEAGFPVERADEAEGVIVTGALSLEGYGSLAKATGNATSSAIILRGEWMPDEESQAFTAAFTHAAVGADPLKVGWQPASWGESQRARAAILKLVEVAVSIPGARVVVR